MPGPVPVSAYLDALHSLSGVSYLWAGKDPHKDGGLDCSGAVTYSLKLAGGPDLTQTWNAQRLYCETSHEEPGVICEGMLAFYGPPNGPATHVMTVVRLPGGDFGVLGATGGNSHTVTPDIAKRLSAEVKTRPRVMYRPDFLKVGKWLRLQY